MRRVAAVTRRRARALIWALGLLLWSASSSPLDAQAPEGPAEAEEPEDDRAEGEWAVFPFVLYTPETGFGAGAAAGYYRRFDPAVEPSSFLGSVQASLRGQFSLQVAPDVYLPGGRRIEGEFRVSRFPDRFYGLGPDTPSELEEDFTSRIVVIRARWLEPLGPHVRVGPQVTARHERVVKVEEDGLLDGASIPGAGGSRVVGVGLAAVLDTRDSLFSPRRGGYLEGAWTVHDGRLGSDFDFHRLVLDARRFLPVGERSVIGLHAYAEAAPGVAPFTVQPLLGGSRRLRGYREGRYRDRFLATVQAEARFPVRGRFGGVVFAAAGDVASRPGDLDLSSLEAAGGVGLRYRLTEEGVVLRGDFALGREGVEVYFTINHAF